MTSVSSSRIATVVCVSRVAICGMPFEIPAKLFTVGWSATVMKFPAFTTGVMSSVTPV